MRLKHPLLVLALLTALLLVPLPLEQLMRRWPALTYTLENSAHPLLFWWLAAVMLPMIRSRVHAPVAAYLATLALVSGFGLATEYAQSLIGRDASWTDVGNDVLGAVFALLLQAARDLRGRWPLWRHAALSAAAVLAGLALAPVAWTSAAYAWRASAFPVLWRSDSMLAQRFAYWKQDAFPGLVVNEPARDWRGYSALLVRLHALRASGTEMRIRVHDIHHNQEFLDRYDVAFVLDGTREYSIRIPMEEVLHGPATREMDLSAVRAVVLFQEYGREAPRFAVEEIRLVR